MSPESGKAPMPGVMPGVMSGPTPGLSLKVTAFTRAQLIEPHSPQVALAGRSNVGKSSLINALAGRKALAKVSATPGKTRSINYYALDRPPAPDQGEAYLVDLPGYGYARCGQAEQKRWADLLDCYFRSTPGLCCLVLLIDSRLTPQKADLDLVAYAASVALPLVPVLTKADKCGRKELLACKRAWSAFLPESDLLVTSATRRTGLTELWTILLERLAGPASTARIANGRTSGGPPAQDGQDEKEQSQT